MSERSVVSVVLLSALLLLGGCADIVSAFRDEPFEEQADDRSWGSAIDDEIIELKAEVNLNEAGPALGDANVHVVSHNGIVLLVGQLPSEELRQQAAQIVARVPKIRRVHNEITVSGKSSYMARTNDSWIATKLKSKLLLEEDVDSGRIKVVTENGVVYLMGMVTRKEADTIADIARQTNGVQKVVKIFEYI